MSAHFNCFYGIAEAGISRDENNFCLVVLLQYGRAEGDPFCIGQLLIQNYDINFCFRAYFQSAFAGIGSYQQKKYENAVMVFNRGLKLVADNDELLSEFYMYLGDAYHSLKDTSESDKAYEKSLSIKNDNAYVLNN